jgi:hypothetical protein
MTRFMGEKHNHKDPGSADLINIAGMVLLT